MKAVSDRDQWTPTDRIVRGFVVHLVVHILAIAIVAAQCRRKERR